MCHGSSLPGKLPLSPRRTQGPRPSSDEASTSLDKCASPSMSPGAQMLHHLEVGLGLLRWFQWAHTRQHRGQLPVGLGGWGRTGQAEGPRQTNRGPLPASPSSWQRKLEGSPSRPTASTHTLAGGCGRGSGWRVRLPLLLASVFLFTFPCLGPIL